MATKTYYDTSTSTNVANDADLIVVQQGSPLASDLTQMKKTTIGTLRQPLVDAINGKYTKPSSGIPESDLSSSVQTKLNTHPVTDVTVDGTSVLDGSVAKVVISGKVDKVEGKGLSTNDYTTAEKNSVASAVSHIADSTIHVTSSDKTSWSGKYDKPSGGIPKSDLASSVQASLNLADSAIQSHQDISGKADKVSGATANNFAGLDSNGNLIDSGSKASDFLTSHQDISGKEDKSNKVSAFQSTPDNNHYPSEKLVKDSLDGKVDTVSGKGLSTNDYDNTEKGNVASAVSHIADSTIHVTSSDKTSWSSKSTVSVSASGSSTDEVQYITIDGVEKKLAGGGSGEAVWGSITGTLSNQTDLQAALDSKLSTDDSSPAVVVPLNADTLNNHADTYFASRVSGATSGNLAGLDSSGNITDSGSSISDFEVSSNKVTSISSSSTDTQYPSAKCVYDNVSAKSDKIVKGSLSLPTASWTGSASPYSQTVVVSGSTVNSKIDLDMDYTALNRMIEDGTNAIYIANNNNVLTAYAVGEKPTADMTVQYTKTELGE